MTERLHFDFLFKVSSTMLGTLVVLSEEQLQRTIILPILWESFKASVEKLWNYLYYHYPVIWEQSWDLTYPLPNSSLHRHRLGLHPPQSSLEPLSQPLVGLSGLSSLSLFPLQAMIFETKTKELRLKFLTSPQKKKKKMCCAVLIHFSWIWLCNSMDCSPPGSSLWNSPGKNTGVGCHFLLQKENYTSSLWLAPQCGL